MVAEDKVKAGGTDASCAAFDMKSLDESVAHIIDVLSSRVGDADLERVREAYAFAKEAHKNQRRKSGTPYIIHPVAVAKIAAEELRLDVNSVICAFLHDVVEDTDYTIEDISSRFGDDVAFLVDVVTKKKKSRYRMSKQVDNYQQLLDSLHFDIRALMIKIADRLHNMRTLSSMSTDKQMKIAGETDYFYAPLANRLGLFDVKTDLENLSFKYRCPHEYDEIASSLHRDMQLNEERLDTFCSNITRLLARNGVTVSAKVYYRMPYSIWRKMKSQDKDYKHIDNRYYIRVTFKSGDDNIKEKNQCLRIYSILTDVYKEKPLSFVNQIDQAKENSYQSLNVMLLSGQGVWEDVQICSERMVEVSRLGCMSERNESNVGEWIERFKGVLEDIAKQSVGNLFIESVVTSLYYDDIMVFTPKGKSVVLPVGSTAIDFAFEMHTEIGMHAQFARINGKLASIRTVLKRGDCVEIGVSEQIMARSDWFDSTSTYKAKRALRAIMQKESQSHYVRCPLCNPIPGGEIIGCRDDDGRIMIHARSCPDAIRIASKQCDRIVAVDFKEDSAVTYPVTVTIKALDRYHLLMDLLDVISSRLHLSVDSLHTITKDHIVTMELTFFVHGIDEKNEAIRNIYEIKGIDEIRESKN
jgi:GTP diphosphokinase / guanosine-3',5'-bis(diphosphate) 3'-diphosphatase